MSKIYDSTNNILSFFGILIGLVLVARCFAIFVCPLFCYRARKISITETTETIETTENVNNVFISDVSIEINDIKNLPIADAEYNDIEEDEISHRIPIATIV